MRSLSSLVILILSFFSFAVSGSTTHSSPVARNPISSRQFHYPRALIDVCADIDLTVALHDVLGLDIGSVLGDICLCLSAFPLNLDLYADLKVLLNLLGDTELEVLLKTIIEDKGTKCTYPEHASPHCTSGNHCDFTCTDGFVKQGGQCVCPLPHSVCNGKCGSYPNGCSSALPKPPKMARRSTIPSRRTPSPRSGGLLDGLLGDVEELVKKLLKLLDIEAPISGAKHDGILDIDLSICIGSGITKTQSLLDSIIHLVKSLLSTLLGAILNVNVKSSCPASVDPDTIYIGLKIHGLLGGSLGATLDKILKAVTELLSKLLGDVKIVVDLSA